MRLILAAAAMLALAAPAFATPLATVAGNPIVRTGPGDQYNAIGRVAAGTSVTLSRCTPDADASDYSSRNEGLGSESPGWCEIEGLGWVDASFVVGMSAKINVTPAQSLVDTPTSIFADN